MATPELTAQRQPLIDKRIWTILALVIIVYLPVLIELISDWYNDDNYTHGFLILPVALWLIWSKRKELAQTPTHRNDLGLVFAIGSLLLLIAGTAGAEYFTTRVSFVTLLFSLSLYMFGWPFTRKIWFAFFFMLFMIPIPYVIYYSLTFPMQLFASKISTNILNLIDLPLIRQGNIIHIPNYSMEVAEACSGIRSLFSLLALGALYAYFTQPNKIKAVILFLSTIPIAIAGNVFRITVTALGAHLISTEFAEGPLHEVSGMIVFVFSLLLLLIFGAILKWKKPEFKHTVSG
ncbi:MAG: exosortase/archaeosortase family protein [candidate division Zixibacteria bacterium]|nr:exosortase/archaeosortase family protein [candidate division Zixibacteria bacterium]NIR63529.1 exosortase/archaeosortase family protein [candidate division Zixibacteria bacterium]NIS17963.1 exosortase/archaeosortase family protein [candidate division Zixibacteria bacterium]NIS46239.1 exosortase/archaeosortase family protein [candidate division Zixibacteria bacterium]NIT54246.1 exosortase/archaeosortase family protein [candidate division Zixibacteria bacterium]